VTLLPFSRTRFGAVLAVFTAVAGVGLGQGLAAVPAVTAPMALEPTATPAAEATQTSSPTSQAGIVSIESDRQQADNSTGVVTATGNVRIVYPDRRVLATSRQAQYFSREARVVLSGDVRVVQEDGSRLLAEQVVYDVSLERLDARPIPGAQVISIVRLKRDSESGAGAPVIPAPIAQPSR
jgi:lipopolysaccharide export system protein LptA